MLHPYLSVTVSACFFYQMGDWLPPLQVASNKSVSVVGVNPPSDRAAGRIAEMRRRSMLCIA